MFASLRVSHERSCAPLAVPPAATADERAALPGTHDFGRVDVHAPARAALGTLAPQIADALPAAASTPVEPGRDGDPDGTMRDGVVRFAPRAATLPANERLWLVAHEAAHAAQAASGAPPASAEVVERDADRVASAVLAGQRAVPLVGTSVGVTYGQTPHDRMVVERARRRLVVLRAFLDEWAAREARRTRNRHDAATLLTARRRMDAAAATSGADLVEMVDPGGRERMELDATARMNRRPVTIEATDDAVTLRVRFHVLFQDPASASRFGEVAAALQQGADLVWGQRLTRILAGRSFRIVTEAVAVRPGAARDPAFWLLEVRPRDDSPVQHAGCRLDQPPAGVVAAATDPLCDSGVMNIPPRAIRDPHTLGHELMHLFGLVDRYMMTTSHRPGQRPQTVMHPTRETGGRRDPLGGQPGTILQEDLGFVLDRLGVLEVDAARGLETLRRLEAEGMTQASVVAEIHRQEEIVRLGRDPRSLIPRRTDFNDRMMRDAENL